MGLNQRGCTVFQSNRACERQHPRRSSVELTAHSTKNRLKGPRSQKSITATVRAKEILEEHQTAIGSHGSGHSRASDTTKKPIAMMNRLDPTDHPVDLRRSRVSIKGRFSRYLANHLATHENSARIDHHHRPTNLPMVGLNHSTATKMSHQQQDSTSESAKAYVDLASVHPASEMDSRVAARPQDTLE